MKKKLLMMASALLLAAGTLFAAQGLTADLPGSGMADVYGIGSKLTKGNVGGFVPRYVAAPPRVHNLTEHTQFLPLPRAGVQNVAPERLAATPVVQGYVIYSDFWSTIGASEYGYYDIPLNGSLLNSLFISNYSMNGGGCVVDGTLHGVYYYNGGQSVFVLHYDLATGQMTATEASIGAIALDMAADPLTGDIYGCFYTDDAQNFCLGKLNPTTGERTKIYQLTTGDDDADMAWNACAIDGNGQLYAINQAGKLYRVDKESGSMRLIGATGVTPGYLSSACIDPVTGDMYWSVMTTDVQGFLYKVDKSTGAATLIEQLRNNEEIVALHVPARSYDNNVPDMPADLAVTAVDGALDAVISFTMPATLASGNPATGACSYAVYVNGEVAAAAEANYGDAVTVSYTAPMPDIYTVSVAATNSVGEGPANKTFVWLGPDQPTPIAEVTLTNEGTTMTLNWSAPTASVHGGYFVPEEVTYDIVRMPDAVKVATGLTETTYTETLEMPASRVSYSYQVTPAFGGVEGLGTTSNAIALGDLTPPFCETFDDVESIAGWKVIDNGDGTTWFYNSGNVAINYNASYPKDDYLVTPAITLQTHDLYEVSFDIVVASAQYPETVEVVWGTEPTAAALTNVIVPATVCTNTSAFQTLSGTFMVPEDGKYYIAIHAMSPADMYWMIVDNFAVSAPQATDTPAAPDNFIASADYDGSLTVTMTGTMPTTDIEGNPLTDEMLYLICWRDDEVLNFIEVAPGQDFTLTDVPPTSDYYTYSVGATSEKGLGLKTSSRVFAGINIPAYPTNAAVVETSTLGTVEITWDAPAVDRDGRPINPALVTYNVVGVDESGNTFPIALGISETTCTYQEQAPTAAQRFVYYGVGSTTDTGTLGIIATNRIPIGPAYKLPYADSFAGGSPGFEYLMENSAIAGRWGLAKNTTFGGSITAQDDDNGFIYFYGTQLNASSSLVSGKISLDYDYPEFTFYYVPLDVNDINTIEVYARFDGEDHLAGTTVMAVPEGAEFVENMWVPASVDLTPFRGKNVQLIIKPNILSHAYVILDNFNIHERYGKDLKISGLHVPAKIYGGQEFFMTFTIENIGMDDAHDYTFVVYHNGEPFSYFEHEILFSGEKHDFKLPFTLEIDETPGEHDFSVVIEYEGDRDLDNNVDGPVVTTLEIPDLPYVDELYYNLHDNGDVELWWYEPDAIEDKSEPRTDTFEGETHLRADGFGDWTVVDADKNPAGTFGDIVLGVEGQPMGFFPVDNTQIDESAREAFEAHSGSTFIAALWSPDGGCDDWMISPALKAGGQTVTLWARSFDGSYPESFEILSSTTNTETESFRRVALFKEISGEWTEYTVTLPEDARFFAIRCVSPDAYMLMIDDVTFTPSANGGGNISLLGYNIYDNGELLNDEPWGETTYTHVTGNVGIHNYHVTTVYDCGETRPSSVVSLELSSLNKVAQSGIVITADACAIVVTGAAGNDIVISGVDGKTLARAKGADRSTFRVLPGTYVVKAGNKVAKVAVR